MKKIFLFILFLFYSSTAFAWTNADGWLEQTMVIPGGPNLPSACADKQVFDYTAAASGARFYLCENGTWKAQGSGGGGGGGTWGSITGILSNQTDLQNALNAKVSGPTSSTNNALPRFDGTDGKSIKDYSSTPITAEDNGRLTVQEGQLILGNASDTTSYITSNLSGTNDPQLSFDAGVITDDQGLTVIKTFTGPGSGYIGQDAQCLTANVFKNTTQSCSSGANSAKFTTTQTNSGASAYTAGVESYGIRSAAGNAGTGAFITGAYNFAEFTGTGTQGYAMGFYGKGFINNAGGTLSNAFGVFGEEFTAPAGTITNNYAMGANGSLLIADGTTNADGIQFTSALGTTPTVSFYRSGAGILNMASINNTNNENLTIDMESLSNGIIFGSTTGVNTFSFSSGSSPRIINSFSTGAIFNATSMTNSSSGSAIGFGANITNANSSATSTLYGGDFQVIKSTTTGGNSNTLIGARGIASYSSTGTQIDVIGLYGKAQKITSATGTITDGYSIFGDLPTESGGGTITNKWALGLSGDLGFTSAIGTTPDAKISRTGTSELTLTGVLKATNAIFTTPAIGAASGATLGLTGALTTTQSIAATSTDGVILTNTTAAANNAQQWSPRTRWTGQGWGTSGSASQTTDFIAEMQPIQGINPIGSLVFSSQVNGGGYTNRFALTSGGRAAGTSLAGSDLELFGSYSNALTQNVGDRRICMGTNIGGIRMSANYLLGWSATNAGSGDANSTDTFLTRGSAAATVQQGTANAASPVAQTLQAQGSRAGTDSNVGGANYTITSGAGTGTGTLSALILQAPVAVASGSGAQTQTTGLIIKSGVAVLTTYAVANLPVASTAGVGAMSFVSDASSTAILGLGLSPTGGGSNKVIVYSDGTSWIQL